ncbi:MAG TPA: hypothetical protein VF153_04855 [Candidatus Limnocylindria bacterium]
MRSDKKRTWRTMLALLTAGALALAGCQAGGASASPQAVLPSASPSPQPSPKTLLPNGIWEVELSTSELAAAGAPDYAAGLYRWTFDDTRAHITAPAPWGGLIECDAEASAATSGVLLTYGRDSGCGAGEDRIAWTLDGAGLHLTLLATTGDFDENSAYLEAKPWQPAEAAGSPSPPE